MRRPHNNILRSEVMIHSCRPHYIQLGNGNLACATKSKVLVCRLKQHHLRCKSVNSKQFMMQLNKANTVSFVPPYTSYSDNNLKTTTPHSAVHGVSEWMHVMSICTWISWWIKSFY